MTGLHVTISVLACSIEAYIDSRGKTGIQNHLSTPIRVCFT